MDMGCLMRFHDDTEGSFLEIDCADALNWYFLYGGGSYASVMEKLNGLTGPAPILPRYAMGFTQSKERYITAEELTGVAREYRKRKNRKGFRLIIQIKLHVYGNPVLSYAVYAHTTHGIFFEVIGAQYLKLRGVKMLRRIFDQKLLLGFRRSVLIHSLLHGKLSLFQSRFL